MHNAIFKQANQQLGGPIHWMPLSEEGTSNWLYQGSNRSQLLILRVNARDPMAFGVCRQREAQILQHIAGQEWAMEVLCNRPDQGWCVMQHHGLSPGADAITGLVRDQLLEAVTSLQRLPLPSVSQQASTRKVVRIDYPALFQRYQQVLNQVSDPEVWLELLNRLVQTFAALPDIPETYVHHDLHPGNLCWQNNRLVLIDWEYAGVGNPWFDAASLYRECGIDCGRIQTLPAFRHLSQPLFKLGLQQAVEAAGFLGQLWYKARAVI